MMGPGLSSSTAIGKFLNGNLPSLTPNIQGRPDAPALLSQTGAFANLANLTPNPGVIPYDMIEPFWSDGADKKRWLAIPNDGSPDSAAEQIQFSANEPWIFPKGAVLIKHFELEGRRLETRFEVKGDDDVYYYLTYRWNNDQDDATLLTDALDETIIVSGGSQVWHYPSRIECLDCHQPVVGSVLGLKTRYLNKEITYPSTGQSGNQLVTLSHIGLLNQSITDATVGGYMAVAAKDDLSASLEYRARSYIDVNCSNCHQPGVDNVALFDARITTPIEEQNLIYGDLTYDEGLVDPKVILPQDVGRSMTHFRMNSLANGVAMPPLAKRVVDDDGVALIAAWINSIDPNFAFPPEAILEASPIYGQAPLVVTFDATASTDQNGDNLSYTLDLGDGDSSNAETVNHTYNSPGVYEATLVVSDGTYTDETTVIITVDDSSPGTNVVGFTDGTALLDGDNYSGVALAVVDMNADGRDDIIRFNNGRILNVQYQTNPGQPFNRYQIGSVSSKNQWSICIADYDQNGFNDILCGGAYDLIKLYRNNNGNNAYTVYDLPSSNIFIQGSNFVDINGDGWADIFACHDDAESRAYANLQNGTFQFQEALLDTETIPSSDNSGNYGSIWTDYDNDGDLDLYISKCRGGVNDPNDPRRINMLMQNDGNNNFSEAAAQANLKIGRQTWLTDFGDMDNDGDLDAIVINHSDDPNLMRNNGNGTFTDVTVGSGITPALDESNYYGIQALFRDFNNDGYVDLLATGDSHYLFYNNGDGTFTEANNPFNSNGIQSLAVGDLNHDGFLDVYAGYASGLNDPSSIKDRLWLNDGNNNNYIAIELVGNESNINGIGARVELYGAWGKQIREVRSGEGYGIMNSLIQHFGIGQSTQITKVVVKWPSGITDEINNPEANQQLTIYEGSDANFTYARQIPFDMPATVLFDASTSDFNLGERTYSWNFGDGNTGTGFSPIHEYASIGTYRVVLTATDIISGEIDRIAREVTIVEGCASLVGQPCGDPCIPDGIIQEDCSCLGIPAMDSDGDGFCDAIDICPEGDDALDINGNNISDCCDDNPNYNFNINLVIGYDPGQDLGTYAVQDDGATLFMTGNTWKAMQIDYDVTPNTVLLFDFRSTNEGEIHEIGFDNDLIVSPDQRIVVYGNQGFAGDVNVNRYAGGGSWVSYQLNIGASFTGSFTYLVLTADDDADGSGNSYFRNLRLMEDADGDGVPDGCDSCPIIDDQLIGTACDDGDPCTVGDVYTSNCNCLGVLVDFDQDGICDALDDDLDNDGIPNAIEDGQTIVIDESNPVAGSYVVTNPGEILLTIRGGEGGGGSRTRGGQGATVMGRFMANAGDVIRYVVGEGSQAGATSAGGGGSTGVFINGDLVMVAGGGGGGDNSTGAIGLGGHDQEGGLSGTGTGPGIGGSNGDGGSVGSGSNSSGANGGGINGVGANAAAGNAGGGQSADLTPGNGLSIALGGNAGTDASAGGSGFTGGGGGGAYYAGGGGGYAGGGAGGASGGAGGGGSYLNTQLGSFISGGITSGANGAVSGVLVSMERMV